MMKPIAYDPDKMAQDLARARELGNLPPKEGGTASSEGHDAHHRRQAHSFDLRREREEVQH